MYYTQIKATQHCGEPKILPERDQDKRKYIEETVLNLLYIYQQNIFVNMREQQQQQQQQQKDEESHGSCVCFPVYLEKIVLITIKLMK